MAKILVVDDESDIQTLFEQHFRKEIKKGELEFIFAFSGEEALGYMKDQEQEAVLILSDINMPGMSGLELLKHIREKHEKPPPTVMIITAYGDNYNYHLAMQLGADDFLTKPVNFEDLELTMEKTIHQVNLIRETLKAIKENNILKMYVDENVLNFMGSREYEASIMANETLEATVAFVDICSFTSIRENEKPDTVVSLLNMYFDLMAKEIIAQQGIIDKFIGDCVMAVFKGPYHTDRAIDACLAIRNKIEALPGIANFMPKVSVGINSGEMISGNIGSATLRRLDYTVIGDSVNTAQRMQTTAGIGQIVISEASWEKVKDSFNCKPIGPCHFKNKVKEVMLYEVLN